ncbi:MAG TPA: hypothetical protein VJJ21_03755 [Candidatus Nanoarchaeia archaeon]|nr:hypothetical protein [Candidatus Nanoarchaeia archaeon]
MDPELSNIIQAGMYSVAAVGSVTAFACYSFLKRKSNNETYADRTQAEIEQERLEVELGEKRLALSQGKLDLMKTPEYQEYLEKRLCALKELRDHSSSCDEWATDHLKGYLDAIVGRSPLMHN